MHVLALPVQKAHWVGFFVSLTLTTTNAFAGAPQLAFDFGRTAECREILSESAQQHYSDRKLVELNLRVSVHLLSGSISDVDEVRIENGDCDQHIRVESFAPSTQLHSEYSDDITVTKSTESGKNFGATLGGEAPVPLGDVVAHVLPSINGGMSSHDVRTETQKRKAPQYAVVASGTIRQEHGVFFKLRSSPQSTLEGTHELTVRFRVPDNWRGDSLKVCCTATGQEKFLWTKQQTTWARTCAPVAVYLAGDVEARTAAEAYVAQRSL